MIHGPAAHAAAEAYAEQHADPPTDLQRQVLKAAWLAGRTAASQPTNPLDPMTPQEIAEFYADCRMTRDADNWPVVVAANLAGQAAKGSGADG